MRPELQIANHVPASMLTATHVNREFGHGIWVLHLDLTSVITQDWYLFLLVNVTSIFHNGQDLDIHLMFAFLIRDHIPVLLCLPFFSPQRFTECLLYTRHLIRCTRYNEEHDSHGSCFHKFIMHLWVKISSNHDTLNNFRVTKNKTVFGETHTPCPIFSMGSWKQKCTLIHGTLTTFQRLWEFDRFASWKVSVWCWSHSLLCLLTEMLF